MLTKKINTILSSIEIYTLFKDEPFSFFLDSGMDHEKLGQFSFIGFDPFLRFYSKGDKIELYHEHREIPEVTYGDPFEKLRELLNMYPLEYNKIFPFMGGVVGYLGYDLCHHLERLPRNAVDDINISDCYFGFYDFAIIIDHNMNEVFIAALGINNKETKIISEIEQRILSGELNLYNEKVKEYDNNHISKDATEEVHNLSTVSKETKVKLESNIKLQSNFIKEDYLKAIDRIKEYIRSGDIYQANMTQRFECELNISPFDLYTKLRTINPAPFSSFINFGEGIVVSSSPERFIKIKDGFIETRPIKGTCRRGATLIEDEQKKKQLLSSEKDRAELLMIVDLERNDIGKIAKPGTVKVTELFHLETYPTVHHLVSTVIGELKDNCDIIDCLKATFPGGSITGAPKVRAMEIIDELEPTTRNIYTGSIGYIGFNGEADFNIVIRTILCKGNKAYFQVGGGIVWDSDSEQEYQETLDKGKALIKVLTDNEII